MQLQLELEDCRPRGLERGDFPLSRCGGRFDLSFRLFDQLINIDLKCLALILAESILLHLFDLVNRVTANVAQCHLALFAEPFGRLGELLPEFGHKCKHVQQNNLGCTLSQNRRESSLF